MPYDPEPVPGATRWTTILGLCLAMVAAGSFIAFSLVARDATVPLDSPVVAVAPGSSTSPVITFAQPRDARRDGVRPSDNGRDLVLGARLDDGPTVTDDGVTSADRTKSDGCGHCPTKSRETVAGTDDDPVTTPARKANYPHSSGKGNGSSGPSPRGKAKGHHKANGKGHGKHPHD